MDPDKVESLIRSLKRMEKTLTQLAGVSCPNIPVLWDQLDKYNSLLDQLVPAETDKDVVAAFEKESIKFTMVFSELQQQQSMASDDPPPRNVIINNSMSQQPESRVDKPKLRQVTHDGKIGSFRTFWTIFESAVVNNKHLDDAEKSQHLLAAVSSDDAELIAGLSFEDMICRLEKKYRSKAAVEKMVVEKTRAVKMKHPRDLDGLRQVCETAEKMQMAVKECKDSGRLNEKLFSLVYSSLPAETQDKILEATANGPDVQKMIDKLKGELERLEAHQEALATIGTQVFQQQYPKERPKKADTGPGDTCRFCNEPGHFVRNCEKLKEHACKKCGVKGHSAKFCNKDAKQYRAPTLSERSDADSNWRARGTKSEKEGIEAAKWRVPPARVVPKPGTDEPMVNANVVEPTTKDNQFVFQADVDGQKVEFLLDTGAQVNILPESKFPVSSDVPCRRFGTADASTSFLVRGPIQKTMTIADGTELPLTAFVGNSRISLIGRDFIGQYDVKWNEKGLTGRMDGKPFSLKEEALLAESENDVRDNIFLVLPEDLDEDAEPSKGMVCTDSRLAELVNEWSDLTEGLGHTKVAKHYITTDPSAGPINRPERRFAVALKKKAREQVHEMLELGVIQTSTSEYCFQVTPVAKKDGNLRICIDFRPLNLITKLDAYPMPRVDETIEKLAGALIFSKIDLTKGYYQMEIKEEDRHKTAFRFDGQLYEFVRMPFGLASAPQSFMRLMNMVLGDLPFVAIYLDDVTIFSKNMEEHLEHLRQVFERLRKAGLKINKDKCEFGVKAINFLGFKVENNCRQPADEKIEAMRTFPKPRSSQDVHRFVGLTNYFRGLIPDFAHIAAPLYELLKPKCKFEWKSRHEKAFADLKEKMTSQPVVRLPDLDKPFIVKTDACDTGMGAMLLQESGGGRHVIEYASKRFNPTQMRYPVIEKEATAIMWALNKWKPYLWGTPFKIETDHRPLSWLKSKTDCDGKLGNMARRLLEFQRFDIEYIPGKKNEDADAMSRIVDTVMAVEDNSDRLLVEHPEWFETDAEGISWYVADGKRRQWIPEGKRKEVLEEAHDRNCHLGVDRTLALLRSRVFWPGWSKDVKLHIKRCHLCATTKQTPIETAELMPVETKDVEMMDQWSMDIAGPLPPTPSGNKYIIAAQERVSKWPEASAAKVSDAGAIIRWLNENIIGRFGVPKQLTTDRGPQFESREFRNFLAQLNINHVLGAPYHHQSNGLAERLNRSLEQLIRAGRGEEDGKWDEDLTKALTSYRTSKHAITGVSPFEAVMGQPPRLELDARLGTVAPVTSTRAETRRTIKGKLVQAERRMKKAYDARCKAQAARNFDGQRVYWRVPVRKNKLARTFKGPFVAQRTSNPLNYTIRGNGRVTKTVHVNQLKSCHDTQAPLDTLRDRGRPASTAGGVAQ